VTNSNSFREAFERLMRENSTYDILGFNSSVEQRHARYVPLTVRVKNADLQVNTIGGTSPRTENRRRRTAARARCGLPSATPSGKAMATANGCDA
jgi:hypothetical protein